MQTLRGKKLNLKRFRIKQALKCIHISRETIGCLRKVFLTSNEKAMVLTSMITLFKDRMLLKRMFDFIVNLVSAKNEITSGTIQKVKQPQYILNASVFSQSFLIVYYQLLNLYFIIVLINKSRKSMQVLMLSVLQLFCYLQI